MRYNMLPLIKMVVNMHEKTELKSVAEMSDDEYYSLYPHALSSPTMRFFQSSELAHTASNPQGQIVLRTNSPITLEVPAEKLESCRLM